MLRWRMALTACAILGGCEWWQTEIPPPAPGCLSLSREVLDFGTVPVNTPVRDVIRVENDCGDAADRMSVRFSNIRFEDGSVFGFSGYFHPRVPHRDVGFIQVQARSDVAGPHSDTLVAETDHPDFPEIRIPASVLATTSVPTLDSSVETLDTWIGCSVGFPVYVGNEGTGSLALEAVTVSGGAGSGFAVEYDLERYGALPWDIDPGEEVEVEVIFTPVTPGSRQVELSVHPSAVEVQPRVSVTGTAFIAGTHVDRFVHVPAETDERPAVYPLTHEWVGERVELSVDGVVTNAGGWTVRRAPPQLEVSRSAPFQEGAALSVTYMVPPEDCEDPR